RTTRARSTSTSNSSTTFRKTTRSSPRPRSMRSATSASNNWSTSTRKPSPCDYHWSMVLARIQTNLENYPAAIEPYAKAIAIRPDRVDLYTARAGLEERLMRFDEAVSDYEHIYQLAYKDPQWMEKIAAVRARQ